MIICYLFTLFKTATIQANYVTIKRLKRISDLLGLDKSLSSYVSRHSWATLALRKGISVEVISESMGHENETTTRIYLALLGQSVVDKANAEIIRLD
jgi:site-specific recombinase XerD